MKRLFGIAIILALIISLGTSTLATGTETIMLSELSDEECITFLKESGVEIPTNFGSDMAWILFIRETIEIVEANPNIIFPYNTSLLQEFANDIKQAVNEYYADAIATADTNSRSIVDVLQDSIPWGTWTNDYLSYNCYGYAIGRNEWVDPGVYNWVSLGNNEDQYYYNEYANIFTIATWIEADLEALSYTVNVISTTIPETQVDEHTHLICVRKDDNGIPISNNYGEVVYYFHDYHVMKLDSSGSWFHKPGSTQLLRYKSIPSNSKEWLCEGYVGNLTMTIVDDRITYDSDIYFIEYTTPHVYEYASCGVNQHIQTCTICGETTGFATSCVFVNNVCKFCGHTKISESVNNVFVPEESDS